jgi:hypothetical protein
MIDYIYLILILILIGFIVFLIYLSYEYRVKEGFTGLQTINPNINSNYIKNRIQNQGTKFINNYINNINDALNMQTSKDYNKQLEILKDSKNDSLNSKYLLDLKNKLKISTAPDSFPINKLISTIKSKYNSQYLSTFANDNTSYGVLVNDKCMTVNGLCKDDYCLLECQNSLYSSDSQKFTTKRIFSNADAAKVMNVPINSISSTNIYPFNIFSSVVNNKCLTINDDGLTIEKCNLNNIKQQWSISPDENICVLK